MSAKSKLKNAYGTWVAYKQVCIVATGVVGDLCRALEKDILPYCQHIMGWLMVNLEGASINRYAEGGQRWGGVSVCFCFVLPLYHTTYGLFEVVLGFRAVKSGLALFYVGARKVGRVGGWK